jgi:ABC transport system ATP-binding/permease protein
VTSTREQPVAASAARAEPVRSLAVRPIRYGPVARFADWYHGWRDGRSAIPPKPPAHALRRIITTPHREAIIRWAQGGFAQEQQRWEGLTASTLDRLAAASARRDSAAAAVDGARADLAAVSRPLTDAERHRRRHGEEDRPDSVVVQRRLREQWRRATTVRARLSQAELELATASGDHAAAAEQTRQALKMAQTRVLRIHKHAHRRLAAYRRTLIRWHPLGAWVSSAMAITDPELPRWAEFPPPEVPLPRPDTHGPGTPGPSDGDPAQEPPPARLPLGQRTVFGAKAPPADYLVLHGAPGQFDLTRLEGGAYRLHDSGHGPGPFIGGQPVKDAILRPGDSFDFHVVRYRISDDGTELEVFPVFAAVREYDFVVFDLGATNKDKPRLAGMSFVQPRGALLAILGPSGAGKSSLFSAIVGELVPESGDLYFREFSLLTHAAQIRAMLGFVPQDETLFKTLTVRRQLRYAFQLRASRPAAFRERRVEEVCEQLKITDQIDQLVGTLSGGQRKRVSIAMELLSDPQLLMLDEPTSGLDAGMDKEVLSILRDYAARGPTVMVVTHSTEHLDLAGRVLVVAKGGRPVYSGPPEDVLASLEATDYADLMRKLTQDEQVTIEASAYQNGDEVALARAEAARAADLVADPPSGHRTRGKAAICARQFLVLVKRQVALLATRGTQRNRGDQSLAQRALGVVTPLMPLVIAAAGAFVAGLVGGSSGLGPGKPSQTALTTTTLSLLVTLCMLSGQALTYGDVISEYPTIRREHRTGTLTLSVLMAKWVVFAVVAALQALVITGVYLAGWPGPKYSVLLGPASELFVDLAAMTVAAMTLGLLISCTLKKLEQAVAAVTGVSIAQIAFNGAFSDLSQSHALNSISVLLPSRWGVAATAASSNMNGISPTAYHDALWRHSLGQWTVDMLIITGLGMTFLLLAILVLSKRLESPD